MLTVFRRRCVQVQSCTIGRSCGRLIAYLRRSSQVPEWQVSCSLVLSHRGHPSLFYRHHASFYNTTMKRKKSLKGTTLPTRKSNKKSASIPRPSGQAGRAKNGFNLQDAMGLSDNRAQYLKIIVSHISLYIAWPVRKDLGYRMTSGHSPRFA